MHKPYIKVSEIATSVYFTGFSKLSFLANMR